MKSSAGLVGKSLMLTGRFCFVKRTFVRFVGEIHVYFLLDTVVDLVAAGRRQSRRGCDNCGAGCHAAVKHIQA